MIGLIRYLYRSINLLNIALLIACILLAIQVISPYYYARPDYKIPQAKPVPLEEEAIPETVSPSPVEYTMVAEQNLFHPERRIPPEKKSAQELPKPELVLYGTFIGDGLNVAYVEDKKKPTSTPGRGNRQTVLKKGDAVSGFVLKEIEPDKIVLVRGDESLVVHLSQGEKPRTTDVPMAGSGPGAAPAPIPTAVTKPGPATPAPAPLPGVAQPSPQRSIPLPLPGAGRRPLRGAPAMQEAN